MSTFNLIDRLKAKVTTFDIFTGANTRIIKSVMNDLATSIASQRRATGTPRREEFQTITRLFERLNSLLDSCCSFTYSVKATVTSLDQMILKAPVKTSEDNDDDYTFISLSTSEMMKARATLLQKQVETLSISFHDELSDLYDLVKLNGLCPTSKAYVEALLLDISTELSYMEQACSDLSSKALLIADIIEEEVET